MKQINFKKIEKKWQKKWEQEKVFEVEVDKKRKKFYCLEMYPYPSGEGLHIGHGLNYTVGDIFARFKRMNGFNILYPMGYDSFGLPAENAAIKVGIHPKKYTLKSIANFVKQQKILGLSYDWSKMLSSCEVGYYKWNQMFFLKFLEKGLAYRKKAPVNWCPKCNTVLANEQVHQGKCEYHGDVDVEIKHLEQWFFKTTEYADELLKCIDDLEWPERIKSMQRNWIGKSHGTEILFGVEGENWPVFTTRPDTIYGVTFMVIAAQHSDLMSLVTKEQKKEVEKFLKKLKSVSEKELEEMDKEGVFTGSYAINPVTKDKIPIWAGNFVIADYGSGMVMAVPAHDQRDFDFAKKYNIPIKVVINPETSELNAEKMSRPYVGEGNLINSGEFDSLNNKNAMDEITKFLEKKKLGKKTVQYKLRDWLISRQRYWGTPIPIIYCDKCGVVPVPEKDFPVELPMNVKFGKGNPLESAKNWISAKCPKCNSKARRETDTMDTFVDSSWYYMRYPDNKNEKKPFDSKVENYWLPVNVYIGGAEHATMHLIYARFWTKALRDMGYINFDEPFKRLFNQGMLHASDGRKMSKSLGNVINPINVVNEYGADPLRLALVSFASPDSDTHWDEKVLIGSLKFLNKVFDKFENIKIGKSSAKIESKLNNSIKEITHQIENFKYNLAVIKIRDLFNSLSNEESKKVLEKSLKLLSPFCPHVAEELWARIGGDGFISLAKWPEVDEEKINKKFEEQEQAVEKLVGDINQIKRITGKEKAKVYVYVLPNEIEIYKSIEGINLFAVNDKEKYDPENKSKKVKPGRPGIYLE
ncbi:MAG: leucine--tRNA ligase [archaeon]